MVIPRTRLAVAYIIIGVIAWALTSLHLPAYLSSGFAVGTEMFWKDALFNSNAAAKFLTVDILMLALAVLIWMVIEARVRAMRGVAVYILLALFVGISLAVPLFLAARERHIARTEPDNASFTLRGGDVAWIAVLALFSLVGSVLTLLQ